MVNSRSPFFTSSPSVKCTRATVPFTWALTATVEKASMAPGEQARRERDVQHREEQQNDEVVRVGDRGQSERGSQRNPERDLRRRPVRVQRLDKRTEQLDERQHPGVIASEARDLQLRYR